MKIIADLHTHTNVSSHAFSSLEEMAAGAKRAGLRVLAITNHGMLLGDAPCRWHFDTLHRLPRIINGVFILRGIELNILPPLGGIDPLELRTMRRMEQVIASFHKETYPPADAEAHTLALENIIKNPFVNTLGHLGNAMFPFDEEYILSLCAKYHKVVEINNGSFLVRKGSRERCQRIAEICKTYHVPIMVNTDAHSSFEVGHFEEALSMLGKIDFPEELVINADYNRLKAYFKELRGLEIDG